jgi:hypothetical protein
MARQHDKALGCIGSLDDLDGAIADTFHSSLQLFNGIAAIALRRGSVR